MNASAEDPAEVEWGPKLCGEVLLELFNFVPDVQCWIKDIRGVYRWANRAFLLNYSMDGTQDLVVGKTDYELSPKHLADQYRLDDERVLAGTSIFGRLELVGRFDHLSSWCLTTKLPVRNAHGKILGSAGITRQANSADLAGSKDLRLAKVLTFIREHYSDCPSNEVLASLAGCSGRGLERLFAKEVQMSPQQYLRRVRVRLSCHDLVYSQISLSEIALKHGFCDQSHFTREFRQEIGQTPREYRIRFFIGTA